MFKLMLFVGLGGFLGSASRYLSQQYLLKLLPITFPIGTFAINMTGCFLIGLIYGLAERGSLETLQWRLFLASGFCGGFTTFSAFSFEILELVKEGQYFQVGLYVSLSVVMGLLATFLGMILTK